MLVITYLNNKSTLLNLNKYFFLSTLKYSYTHRKENDTVCVDYKHSAAHRREKEK